MASKSVRKPPRIVLVCLALAFGPNLLIADEPQSEVTPVDIERVSDRVVVARCPVGTNVTAVNSSRGVVIVDTHLSPGSMLAVRSKIEGVFGKSEFPYVVNTHGDWDHCSGNQVFPGAAIIGHATSPDFMRFNRANSFGSIAWQESLLSRDRQELESTQEPAKQRELRAKVGVRAQIVSSLKTDYVSTPPTVTFKDRFELDLGDLTLQLIYCGPAHSISDILVYVPEEKVVMTGDVFCSPTSFCFTVSPLTDAAALLASVDYVLERGVRVVVPGHGRLMSEAELNVLRDRLAEEIADQSGVVSAARTLERAIEENGAEEGIRLFRDIARDSSSAGRFSEEEFYLLGSRFVDKARVEAGGEVFELAAGYFPKSFLILTGLGRTCLIRGDTLAAIAAYERANELTPDNQGLRATLQRLRSR